MSQMKRMFFSFLLWCSSLMVYGVSLLMDHQDQQMVTATLTVLSVSFAFLWCWPPATPRNTSGRTDFFHPSFLFLAFYLVYFIFSGILLSLVNNYQSNWISLGDNPGYTFNSILTLGTLSIATFGLGLRFRLSFPGKRFKECFCRPDGLWGKEIKFVILLFLIVGGVLSLRHLSMMGALSFDILRFLSPSARREASLGINNIYMVFESMFMWSFLFLMFLLICKNRYIYWSKMWGKWFLSLVFFIVVAVLVFVLSGKRSAVIPLLLLPLIWRHYLVNQITFFRFGVLLAISSVLISLLLMVRIVVPLVVQGHDVGSLVGDSVGEITSFYLNSAELATFDMIAASYLERDSLLAEMGGPTLAFLKYNFGVLLAFIPRSIWANKPLYEDVGHVFYQSLVGSANAGFAVTVWGTSFLFFHVAGIIWGMFVLGWILKGVYSVLRPWEGRPVDVFLYGVFYWTTFQFLRFGTLGFTLLYFVTAMSVGVLAVLFLCRNTKYGPVS